MPINVVNQFELQWTSTDLTVGELKHHIQRRSGTPATMQFLFHKGNELNNEDRSLSEYGLNLDSTLILIIRSGDPQLGDEDGHGQERTLHIMNSRLMNVFEFLTTIDLEGTDTVLHLEEEICRVLGCNIQSQRLDTGDSPLNNRSRIHDIPELMIHPVVHLTILPGYRFNTN
ncbi:hypothetical protein M0R45_037392 [Rubus argutus]|uniref:Ubiquitin-like domain-containing protein n=1 Tax=Rubus argutus TaxID=59490 RepID=A0AAW1W2P6_RUBAR